MKDTDVLVVGAGPTGLTLAAALLSRGIRVAVVDKLAAGANTSRAAAVNSRTPRGARRSRRVPADGQGRSDRAEIHHAAGPAHPDPRRLQRAADRTSVHPDALPADTERLLLERLHELGGDVVRPKALSRVTQDESGVTATFDDGDTLRAGYAVGADGMQSTVRAQAGIGFAGGEFAESFTLADVRVTGQAPRNEVILFYAKDGLTVLAPLPGDIFRVVAPTADAPQLPSAKFVQALLDARGFGPGQTVVTELVWGSRFHIHHRVADSYRAGRLLLAGDAAHVHSPAGGQGMNLGITDAVALAGALAEVLHGGPDAALDAYSTAQRRRAERVLRLTGRLTRVATLPRPLRPLRNTGMRLAAGFPAVRRRLAVQLSGLTAE